MPTAEEARLNADRFRGFADIYDDVRPRLPVYAAKVIARYLGHAPSTVVDLGCGTGLSTLVWKGRCDTVIGVEPSEDMLAQARSRESAGVGFRQGYSHDTGLPDGCADAVVCSQSFHWMEPESTLREADRLLKPGGVFAAVDYDWPPLCGWEAELAYQELRRQLKRAEEELPALRATFRRWEKEGHLANIRGSGRFRFVREVVFLSRETGSAERYRQLAMSEGGVQSLLKLDPDRILPCLQRIEQAAEKLPAGEFPLDFCYRMRIGIK